MAQHGNDREQIQAKAQAHVDRWNGAQAVGSTVAVEGYAGLKTTRTEAMLLFEQKPVIYLEGYNGYFDLADVAPVQTASGESPALTGSDRGCIFPGQGSQEVGMGGDLFGAYPELVRCADEILGYSIEELCTSDPQGVLSHTQYTQPALYTVNALAFLDQTRREPEMRPAFLAGHSLGEYSALFAAGVFDFPTGLKLVQRRGALMAEAKGGGMAAVIGMDAAQVAAVLEQNSLTTIDIANHNTPVQTVISGMEEDVLSAQGPFEDAGARLFIPLKVSGAFHSRYMKASQTLFREYLDQFEFKAPSVPVVSNVTAKPYEGEQVRTLLADQLTSPVQWSASIRYLADHGVETFTEIGPGKVLSGMVAAIVKTS